nr:TetR/AcrR family transcriptional regulator [Clostridioides difficile]
MATKGMQTKQFIIDTSIKLFSEKGYSNVTMKDICEACNLSRGGLYRHFNSTKEIFIDMLNSHKDNSQNLLDKSIKENISARQMLEFFLNQQKSEIQSEYSGLDFAIHEFAFVEKDQHDYMNKRYNSAITMLVKLIDSGQSKGEFKKCNSRILATHIMFLFDSMKTSAHILVLTDEDIDNQINLIKDMVILYE